MGAAGGGWSLCGLGEAAERVIVAARLDSGLRRKDDGEVYGGLRQKGNSGGGPG